MPVPVITRRVFTVYVGPRSLPAPLSNRLLLLQVYLLRAAVSDAYCVRPRSNPIIINQ